MTREKNPEEEYDEAATQPPRLPWVLVCHKCCAKVWTVNHPGRWGEAIADRLKHEEGCEGALKPSLALG